MANKDDLWFVYAKKGVPSGPFNYHQLVELHARGEIDGSMLCERKSFLRAFSTNSLSAFFPEFNRRREAAGVPQTEKSVTLNTVATANHPLQTNATSGWVSVLRFTGIVSGIAGFIGFMIGIWADNADVRLAGWYLLVVGLGNAIYSFFAAFLVDVFLDIRLSLRKLVDQKSKE